MNIDIYGNDRNINNIEIEIFADEIKPFTNKTGEEWLYIGILIVPIQKKSSLLDRLNIARSEEQCNSEIKSTDLDHSYKRKLAQKWVGVILEDKNYMSIYSNVLGINLSNLNKGAFGNKEFESIYNRFFRTCLLSAIKRCFPEQKVNVLNVFHDEGDQSHHAYFPWHSIYFIEKHEEEINFSSKRVVFINSDHRENNGCNESHLIQLIDLIMGISSHCLDSVSSKKSKDDVARFYMPLLERMMNKPDNKNSRYGYSNKYLISFFPNKKLTDEQLQNSLARVTAGFYHQRPLLLLEKISGQETLFKHFSTLPAKGSKVNSL
jgi:hypothetical protein